jgi:predicted PP-loop superfamily ATPase
MAKAIYVCRRNTSDIYKSGDDNILNSICKKLQPDNLTRANHKTFSNGKSAYAIMNYQPSIRIKKQSLLLGYLYEPAEEWNETGSGFPDGSYAMFRNNKHSFEALSDILASRTIWYYHDDELFIASTSQRAIIMFLGSFEFDERVIPWMLSSGTLGPELSWDKRINKLRPNSSVLLDKKKWHVSVNHIPFHLSINNKPREEHKETLEKAIEYTLRKITDLDFKQWPVTLSGGYDSRAILLFLKKINGSSNKLNAITYGLQESVEDECSDAYIAKELAAKLQARHTYYSADKSDETMDKIIDRYLICGEGRIDHLSAYLDGMKMWKDFLEKDGIQGIIRGDVIFFPYKVFTEFYVKHHLGCALCADFKNLENIITDFGLPEQQLTEYLERKKGESIDEWCDRLYQTFRYPTIHGALSDIKLSFVEIINPLISKKIIRTINAFPDDIRKDNSIFKELVNTYSPQVPYASKSSTNSKSQILREPEIVNLINKKLKSPHSNQLFSTEFIDFILKGVSTENTFKKRNYGVKHKVYRYLKQLYLALKLNHLKKVSFKLLPRFSSQISQLNGNKPVLDGNVLAFRVFIIVRMTEILHRESTLLKPFDVSTKKE